MQTLKILTSKVGFILSFCLLFNFAKGQLCTGTLGEPVVNIDFGHGAAEFGPPLKAQLPNLKYFLTDCLADGYYTIRKNVHSCYFSSWHQVDNDHTPSDSDGYMMVINASLNSGDFYIDTITGLCGGNVYEFAAWVMNIQKPNVCSPSSKPNLEFKIETLSGQVLASYKTGDIATTATPTWNQLGLFFKTPIGVTNLILRITNAAPGGCGNDLALDDITFRPCGPPLSMTADGYTGSSASLCLSSQTKITMRANLGTGYTNPVLRWQKSIDSGKTWTDFNNGSDPYKYDYTPSTGEATVFRVTVAEQENIDAVDCRIVSNTFTVNIYDIVGDATVSSPACTNSVVTLDGGNGTSFQWTGPNGFTSNQQTPKFTAQLSNTGFYYLEAVDNNGCQGKDTLFLQVYQQTTAAATSPFQICSGDSVQLDATGGTNYKWIPSTGLSNDTIPNPIAAPTETTNYSVVVGNGDGCKDTATVVVNVSQTPTANAGPDQVMLAGQSITLLGQATGTNTTILWTPSTSLSNPSVVNPVASPSLDIVYTLTVTSDDGCGEASDDVFVKVFEGLKIPNAFSPNGDGINDTWRIDALAVYPNNETTIFDRYGREVFKSKGGAVVWNGTRNGMPVPVGVYYYYIDLKKDGDPPLKGSIAVIR